MAEAKITLSTIVNDEGLKELNTSLAKSQTEAKRLQREIRSLEKNTSDADKKTDEYNKKLQDLTQRLNECKQASKAANKEINDTINSMQQGNSASGGFVDKLKEMANLTGVSTNLMSISTAAIAVAGGLVAAGREASKFSNQFIAFARNSQDAAEMYNKFNEVYRNTNYDEQKVYDMAKSFLAVGMNSEEAAANITKTADASAKLGRGVEFAEDLNKALTKLYTGSQLTERQYQQLAQAGIDLTDVQDQMAKGGMEAYNALRDHLDRYAGGMNRAKQSAAEMEGDIKGNLVEIARQTALLVDDFFGFSDALKSFYQWVIDSTQVVIDGLKRMISAVREAKAEASDHADVLAEIGTVEEAIGDKSGEAAEKAAAEWQRTYNERMASLKAEREEIESQQKLFETPKVKPVQAISVKGSTISSSGGGGVSSRTVDKTDSKAYQLMQQSNNQELNQLKSKLDFEKKSLQIKQEMALVGVSDSERVKQTAQNKLDNLALEKEAEQELYTNRLNNLNAEIAYLEEHPFDGSDKKIESLYTQAAAEMDLHTQRVQNLEQLIELQKKQNDYDILQNNSKLNTVQTQWQNYAKSVATSMGSAVSSVINGEKSMGQALGEMAKQMISNAVTMLAQWVALVAILAAFQDPTPARHASIMMFGNDGSYIKGKDGGYVKRARGGLVTGEGNGYNDMVNAKLSDGEFVLRSDVVDRVGVGYLNSLNAGANPVSEATPIGGSSITLNISTMDAGSFGDFLDRGGLDSIKQAFTDDNRMGRTTVGVW